ncbi:hypothetical protein LINPERPRIM_LOCUS8699, partial [Linum perenne]
EATPSVSQPVEALSKQVAGGGGALSEVREILVTATEARETLELASEGKEFKQQA